MYLVAACLCIYVFFFKQKTAYEMRISDWSSDVCSSDLRPCYHLRRCSRKSRPDLKGTADNPPSCQKISRSDLLTVPSRPHCRTTHLYRRPLEKFREARPSPGRRPAGQRRRWRKAGRTRRSEQHTSELQ